MNENIKAFLKMLAENPELQKKMENAANPDEAYAIASSAQGGFEKDEFVETMQKLSELAQKGDELSEEDLANTAGGLDVEYIIGGGIGLGVLGIGVGALVAA